MCMALNLSDSDEIKQHELHTLNLPRVWKHILEETGPDLFLRIWKIASTPEYLDKNSIYVPSLNKYYEFQQAQFIKTLLRKGLSNSQVHAEIQNHGMQISLTKVIRLRKKFNLGNVKKSQ